MGLVTVCSFDPDLQPFTDAANLREDAAPVSGYAAFSESDKK